MKINKISKYEIKYYFKRHSSIYISFLIVFLVGVIFGVLNSISSDSYLKLLTKENKILYSIINGSSKMGSMFGKNIIKLYGPMILIFLLNLNFYLGLLSYVLIAYQSSMLTLSIFALVSMYGLSGVLNAIFIVVPINVIYIFNLIFFSVTSLKRSKAALKNKNVLYGFKNSEYLIPTTLSISITFLIIIIAVIILPMFLKTAIFIFY